MSGLPRLGFDVVVDKILDIHRDVGRTHDSAKGAVAIVSRRLKSSFREAGGKRAIAADASGETPAPKRRAASVTPSASSFRPSLSTPLPPVSLRSGDVFGPSTSGAMLINQRHAIVPHHTAHRLSVSQYMYKRIPPPEIVRLSPGDEIIVVLPAITSTLAKNALPVIHHYRRYFSRVVDRTLRAISPADRMPIVDVVIRDRHTFLRSNAHFWEFECRVKSYPIREQLELESIDDAVIRTNWDQGAGIDVSVCGYTTQQSVLLKLRDVAYLQFF
jgi:hypothetical protein